MEQFPGNSRPERGREEPPKKVERVVQGEVLRRKTPPGRRLAQNLIGGDAQSVWGNVFGDVLIPAARDMIADVGIQFIERMIFGDSSGGRSRVRRSHGGRTDYHNAFRGHRSSDRYEDPRETRRDLSRRARSTHSFDEILIDARIDAEEVLDRMDAQIDKYGAVTVADFYELCGVDSSYTDAKYGWTDIAGAGVQRHHGKYRIRLPAPEPLD